MADVTVPFGDDAGETAVLLLAAAEEAGEDPGVVRTGDGVFVVDEALAKSAGVDYEKDEDDEDDAEEPPPAKKTASKRAKK